MNGGRAARWVFAAILLCAASITWLAIHTPPLAQAATEVTSVGTEVTATVDPGTGDYSIVRRLIEAL